MIIGDSVPPELDKKYLYLIFFINSYFYNYNTAFLQSYYLIIGYLI